MNLSSRFCAILLAGLALALAAPSCRAQVWIWRGMGPSGGDVKALAVDPNNPGVLYLGTADGHIFGSRDRGDHWQILGRAGTSLETVVTAILVDPRDSETLYAAAWTREPHGEGGGVFRSRDGGVDWESLGLSGHAVRVLAFAPSDSDVLVAGALDGVFLSSDRGAKWQQISPLGDAELQNVDSVAIDPRDPRVIYAGTFHLPWKTLDGGNHWVAIHSGMIDDSDVFSLAVDHTNTKRVFASACSGLYRSDNGGKLWTKIQGIPFAARRTHIVVQDPSQPETVYAGTTEGLWKTTDGGTDWKLMTPANWVVNAMVIEPGSGRVVMGTEQLGVLVSNDGGRFFTISNDGFYHRQIISLALDSLHPGHALAVLANAPEQVLATQDSGAMWFPLGPGLRPDQVRKVYASPVGWLAALDSGGFEVYDGSNRVWRHAGEILSQGERHSFDYVVNDLAFSRSGWFAATMAGLCVSHDYGRTWRHLRFSSRVLPANSILTLDSRHLWLVSSGRLLYSHDSGGHWRWHDLPLKSGGALALKSASNRMLIASAEKGLYISADAGATWKLAAHGLPAGPAENMAIDAGAWFVSLRSGGLYASEDQGATWNRVQGTLAEGNFPLVVANGPSGRIYVASATEGLYSLELGAHPVTSTLTAGPFR